MSMLLDVLAVGVVDSLGEPLASGRAYAYKVGTTTLATIYDEAECTNPVTNPVTLDAAGKAEVYTLEEIRLVIEDVDGVTVDDIDSLGPAYQTESNAERTDLNILQVARDLGGPSYTLNGDGHQTVDRDVLAILGTVYYVGSYSSFDVAVSEVGSTAGTLVLDVASSSAGGTVPANVNIVARAGALLTISDPLTINGPFSAGLFQVFAGAGTVTFGAGAVKEVLPEWWGALGDGSGDCADAINLAADCAVASNVGIHGYGSYKLDAAIDLKGIEVVKFFRIDTTTIDATTAAVQVGWGTSPVGGIIEFQFVNSSNTPVEPQVIVTGTKNAKIDIRYIKYLQFLQDGDITAESANAYNQITLGSCTRFHVKSINGDTGKPAWFNENEIHGGRFATFTMESSGAVPYSNNNNHFMMPTFEATALDIDIDYAYNIIFHSVRFEGTSTARTCSLGSKTSAIVFSRSYTSAATPRPVADQIPMAQNIFDTFSDAGSGNVVQYEYYSYYTPITIAELNTSAAIVLADASGNVTSTVAGSFQDNSNPELAGSYFTAPTTAPGILGSPIFISRTFKNLLSTNFIPVVLGDLIESSWSGMQRDGVTPLDSTHGVRLVIGCYNSNYSLVGDGATPVAYIGCPVMSSTSTTGLFSAGANLHEGSSAGCRITDDAVKFVRLFITSGSANTYQISNVAVRIFSKNNDGSTQKFRQNATKGLSLDTVPVAGYAPLGTICNLDDASAYYTATFSLVTRANGSVAAGGTALTVDTITGVALNDIVGVIMETGTTHWTTVAGLPGGSVITLTAAAVDPDATATQREILDNALVAIMRWE